MRERIGTCAALLVLAACGGGDGASRREPPDPSAIYRANIAAGRYEIHPSGRSESETSVRLSALSAMANAMQVAGRDVEAIRVNLREIRFVSDSGPQVVLPAGVASADLLQLRDDATPLFHGSVPAGRYQQIRLILQPDNGTVVRGGREYPLQVPSGAETGIKLTGDVELVSGLLTRLTLDFRIESLKDTPGRGYLLTPVIEIAEVKTSVPFVPGLLTVRLRESLDISTGVDGLPVTGRASLDALLRQHGCVAIRRLLTDLPNVDSAEAAAVGLDRIYVFSFQRDADVVLAMFDLAQDTEVEEVSPSPLQRPSVFPNDPMLLAYQLDPLNGINAFDGWDVGTGSPGISMAIVDTGVDDTHPDLTGRVVQAPGLYLGTCRWLLWDYTCLMARPDSRPQTAGTGPHGTFVAGIAGAHANNGIGIAGVNWSSPMIAVNVSQPDSAETPCGSNQCLSELTEAAGIIEAVGLGARVINLSMGGYGYQYCLWGCLVQAFTDSTLQAAIQYAHRMGVVVVAAAGNDSAYISPYPGTPDFPAIYPASFPEVISVSALTVGGSGWAWFTNRGKIDMSAPGQLITSTVPGGYEVGDGTSAATPFITGAAASMLSISPSMTPDDVRFILCSTAKDLGFSSDLQGCGRLDLAAALTEAANRPEFFNCRQPNPCGQRWFLWFEMQFTATGGRAPYTWSTESIPPEGGWGQFYDPPPHDEGLFHDTGRLIVPPDNGGCALCSAHFNVCVQDAVSRRTCHRVQFSYGL